MSSNDPLPAAAAAAPRLILGAKTLSASDAPQHGGDGAMISGAGGRHGVVKFISERFEFVAGTTGDAQRLLTDNTDFLVISVLGTQGAGKSSLLNEIAALVPPNSAAGTRPPKKPFPLQTAEMAYDAAHQTVGVDMYVTGERLILLDCQPVLSSSVVIDMVLEGGGVPGGYSAFDHLMELQSVQLAVLLLGISHVVLVVHDDPFTHDILHLLRLADAVRQSAPGLYQNPPPDSDKAPSDRPPAAAAAAAAAPAGEPGAQGRARAREQSRADEPREGPAVVVAAAGADGGGAAGEEGGPQVVFAYTRMDDGDMTPVTGSALARLIARCLAGTTLVPAPLAPSSPIADQASGAAEPAGAAAGATPPPPSAGASAAPSPAAPAGPTAEEGTGVRPLDGPAAPGCNLFLLPRDERLESDPNLAHYSLSARPSYSVYSQNLVAQILSLPRHPFARTLSEREWLHGVGQAWEALSSRSSVLADLRALLAWPSK